MPGLLIQAVRSNTLGNCALVSQTILLPQICDPARAVTTVTGSEAKNPAHNNVVSTTHEEIEKFQLQVISNKAPLAVAPKALRATE